jgi:hypothetical protein
MKKQMAQAVSSSTVRMEGTRATNADSATTSQQDIGKAAISALNASGDDRNLASHGNDPHYWYSVGDGMRLLAFIRQGLHNPTSSGSQADSISAASPALSKEALYSPHKENPNRIFISDPYYGANFKVYLNDDISKITATGNFKGKSTKWQIMPSTIIIPILSGAHWRAVKIDIDYSTGLVKIVYDDPYGEGRFPESLKTIIEGAIKSEIPKLFPVDIVNSSAVQIQKDDSAQITITTYEKQIDQQGRGENSWDCAPITFSNIRDYVKQTLTQSLVCDYSIPDHREKAASSAGANMSTQKMVDIRALDIEIYHKVSEIELDPERMKAIKAQLVQYNKSKLSPEVRAETSTIQLDDFNKKIASLDPFLISMIFTVLENKRLFEGSDIAKQYTQEELSYAYDIVLGKLGQKQAVGMKCKESITKSAISIATEGESKTGEDLQVALKTYTANKTAEAGHPNANGKLSKLVGEVLENKQINTLKGFNKKVYELLWQEPEFKHEPYKYSFKYKFSYAKSLDAGESTDLLFWLLANGTSKEVLAIIDQYKFDISSVQDNNNNNILHIAILYRNKLVIEGIADRYFKRSISPDNFTALINHRNQEGTNPLGMLFLNDSKEPANHIEIIDLIASRRCYDINTYLNNKRGMDYQAPPHLKQIGGYNLLHVAIQKREFAIFEILIKRNDKMIAMFQQKEQLEKYMVDFMYPALNPEHHMTSPSKLLDFANLILPNDVVNRNKLKILLAPQKVKQIERQNRDDSGDSDIEYTPAWHYKEGLLTLNKYISKPLAPFNSPAKTQDTKFDAALSNINSPKGSLPAEEEASTLKEYDKIVIPLFHGVPFIQGVLRNEEKKI